MKLILYPSTQTEIEHYGSSLFLLLLAYPPFLEVLVQKTRTKAPLYKFCLNCLWGFFSGGFCQGSFVWKVLSEVVLPFPILPEYICYIKKLNITLNFMFRMHNKKIYKCDVTCSLPPPPVTNCHTFADPLLLERDVLYGPPLWQLHPLFSH